MNTERRRNVRRRKKKTKENDFAMKYRKRAKEREEGGKKER